MIDVMASPAPALTTDDLGMAPGHGAERHPRRIDTLPDPRQLSSSASLADPRLRHEIRSGARDAIEAVAVPWSDLCDRAEAAPWLRPEWFSAYLSTREPGAEAVLALAWQGDTLCGVLPMIRESTRFHGVPVRLLRPLGDPNVAERYDLVADPACRSAAIATLWEALRSFAGWDVLQLFDVPTDGAAGSFLAHAERDGFQTARRAAEPSPFIPLPRDGRTLDDALTDTTAKFRANVRRRRRNLEKTGRVELVRADRYDPAVFDAFLALEASGWKGKEGTAIAANPELVARYRMLAQAAERGGYLSMYLLTCGGVPVAGHFGLTFHGRYAVPKLAYDETYHQYAPGHLLVYAVLEDLVARDIRELDFLGVNMPWKAEWTARLRQHERLFIFRGAPRGRAAYLMRFRLLTGLRELQRRANRHGGSKRAAGRGT